MRFTTHYFIHDKQVHSQTTFMQARLNPIAHSNKTASLYLVLGNPHHVEWALKTPGTIARQEPSLSAKFLSLSKNILKLGLPQLGGM